MKFAPLVLLAFLLVDVAGAQSGVCLVNPTIHEPPVATSRYGMWRTGRAHEGLDLRSRGGEKLLAAAAGEVVYVGTQTNAGNTVVIKLDNGDYIQYFHMMGYADKLKEGKWKGQRVEAGEVIGTAGKTTASSRVAGGFSTVGPYAPHLHFEYGIPDQNSVKTGIVREDGLRKPKPFGAKKIGGDFASYRTDPAPYYCVDVNFDTGVNKEGKPNVPYRDPNKAPYFGKSIKEQYKILYGETPPGGLAPGQGSSAQVQSANAAAIAAAAEGKAVEEWLSDRDGYGALPTAARGAYANMSSMQMLLTEAERRSISADWHSNITKASSRALWIEYLRMMAISNYLREARMRQNERIQALWSTYLALKAKNDADDKNSLQSQTKAVAQQAIANDMRRKIQ